MVFFDKKRRLNACKLCKTSEEPHWAKGYCVKCYFRNRFKTIHGKKERADTMVNYLNTHPEQRLKVMIRYYKNRYGKDWRKRVKDSKYARQILNQ